MEIFCLDALRFFEAFSQANLMIAIGDLDGRKEGQKYFDCTPIFLLVFTSIFSFILCVISASWCSFLIFIICKVCIFLIFMIFPVPSFIRRASFAILTFFWPWKNGLGCTISAFWGVLSNF